VRKLEILFGRACEMLLSSANPSYHRQHFDLYSGAARFESYPTNLTEFFHGFSQCLKEDVRIVGLREISPRPLPINPVKFIIRYYPIIRRYVV
jgi:hypothetical protein